MTLPDIMEKENAIDARQLKVMSCTLRTCMKQALKRHALTCGMTSCAGLLHSNPSSVMMCILNSNSSTNIGVHIHQTLIQAFCRENNILIIELDDNGKLGVTLEQLISRGRGVSVIGNAEDTSCLLLQFPKRGPSKHDLTLFHFYDEMMAQSYPLPHLTLPD